ncbi:sterile alpha motif domain-containing protein 12 isoform X3 [Lithobates pipiens]
MAVEAIHCNRNSNNIDHTASADNINVNLQGEHTDSPSAKDTSKVPEPKGTPKKVQTEPDAPKPTILKATKPVAFWTQHDVCKWLKKHCPNQYQLYHPSFKEHDITAQEIKTAEVIKYHQKKKGRQLCLGATSHDRAIVS